MKMKLGPGLLVVAAGIGAGDMILGIQLGINCSAVFVAMVIFISIIKYYLTEGLARRQIVCQESMVESWIDKFPKYVSYIILLFLIVWSFMVAGALISAIGLASSSITSAFSSQFWSVFFSFAAFLFVYFGKYQLIENLAKILIGAMFFIVIITAVLLLPNAFDNFHTLTPNFQFDTSTLLFAIIGGVGGSVTMLSYGYWIIEKKWSSAEDLEVIRTDLKLSYFLTALFVLSLMLISSGIEHSEEKLTGFQLIAYVAQILENTVGRYGGILFKVCFWGVVFSSIITVWSGIPYIFSDFINLLLKRDISKKEYAKTNEYRLFLGFISFAPIVLIFYLDTIKNVINYTLISSLFVLILSCSLFVLNHKKHIGEKYANNVFTNFLLIISMLVFLILLIWKLL